MAIKELENVKRPSAPQRGVGYTKWRKARISYLRANPLCVWCLKRGIVSNATVVDHIEPHRGDSRLFWTTSNWQALCKECHDHKTLAHEAMPGCDVTGQPTDPNHLWNVRCD